MPIATATRPITPGQIRRGLGLNITAGSLGMVWVAVALNVPFVMLLEALGTNGVTLGVFSTVRQAAIVAQIPGSLVMERASRRKPLWGTLAILHRALWLVPAWLAWRMPQAPQTLNLILAAVVISTIVECLAAPAWHSWMADLVPPQIRGQFWGTRQAVVTATFLVAIGIAGFVLDLIPVGTDGALTGFALVVACSAVFGVADIIVHLGVPEPARRPALKGRSWFDRLVAPLQHPSFRNLALSMGIWGFACTMSGTFNAIYLKRAFHVSYTGLSALTICGALSTVLASIYGGYLIDRIGARAFAVILMCVAPLCGSVWFFVTATPMVFDLPLLGTLRTSQALLIVCAATFVSGGLYSSVGLCHMSLLGALAPKRERTLAMAEHWTLVGLVGATGPLFGGKIVDLFTAHPCPLFLFGDTRFDFTQMLAALHAVVIWVLAVPFMLRVRARREPLNVGEAFERVVMVNPLRFASGVYHARILSSPSRSAKRRRAAEAIGDAGVEIAIADLVAKLDDPSSDVREATAAALGRIGGPEATDALLRKLDDPSSDLLVAVLRALRAEPEPALAPRLLPFLNHGDTQVVRETIRTLGELRNRLAVPPLTDLLHRTRSDVMIAAASEALGKLGDISAVYVILPRMRTAAAPAVRRTMAVACGDLLGRPDGFYRLLIREEKAHGSAISRLLKGARRTLRHNRGLRPGDAPSLAAGLQRLEALYEADQFLECITIVREMAVRIADARLGIRFDGDLRHFLEQTDRVDPRFTVGAWYVAILEGVFARAGASASLAVVRDRLEVQLAVYLLATWIDDIDRAPRRPAAGVLSLTGAADRYGPLPHEPPSEEP